MDRRQYLQRELERRGFTPILARWSAFIILQHGLESFRDRVQLAVYNAVLDASDHQANDQIIEALGICKTQAKMKRKPNRSLSKIKVVDTRKHF